MYSADDAGVMRMENATEADIEMVKEILGGFCDSDASGGRSVASGSRRVPTSPAYAVVTARTGLSVIERKLLSAADRESLTNYPFDSEQDAQALLKELQQDLFGPPDRGQSNAANGRRQRE